MYSTTYRCGYCRERFTGPDMMRSYFQGSCIGCGEPADSWEEIAFDGTVGVERNDDSDLLLENNDDPMGEL